MVFEIFGRYSDDNVSTVCQNPAGDVVDNLEYYRRALFVVTQMKSTCVVFWTNGLLDKGEHADELAVFCLS